MCIHTSTVFCGKNLDFCQKMCYHIYTYPIDIGGKMRYELLFAAIVSLFRRQAIYRGKGAKTMKIYAVINQKGGVGKTSTAWTLGCLLAKKGKTVLFIDMDAQGNLSYATDAKADDGVFHVMENPSAVKDYIQHLNGYDILAASPRLAGADKYFDETGKEYKLREALDTLKNAYDYVLIDTPPTLGILTVNALTACDGAIVPAQADIFSLQGIGQLRNTVDTVRKYCNPRLQIMGIVLTRYNGRSVIRREVTKMLEQTATELQTAVYDTKIRECISMVEAQALKQSIFDYAPKSNAAKDYEALLDEISDKDVTV